MAWNKKNASSFIFLILFAAILMGFYSIVFRPQNEISEAEQRTLQKIPSFSFGKFTEGIFQSEMDQAVSDQFIFSAEIKQLVKDFDNSLVLLTSSIARKAVKNNQDSMNEIIEADTNDERNVVLSEIIMEQADNKVALSDNEYGVYPLETTKEELITNTSDTSSFSNNSDISILGSGSPDDKNPTASNVAEPVTAQTAETVKNEKYPYIYTEIIERYIYKLDDSGYIVQKASDPKTYDFDIYDSDMLEKVTYPKYLYLINSSMSVDFREPHKYDPLSVIKQYIKMDGYDELKFDNFEEYKKLFYQTDHHWNYRGSYEGYKQCMRLLEGDDVKLLEPTGTHTYHTIYNGSLARDNALKCSTEEFTVYEFDIPPYETYVDDEKAVYGYRYLYVSDDDFPHSTYSNHYGMYYGDDHAKVVYKFNNPDAQSLLILATSYSNAVNELIASHYKETHILDFRHYRKKYGKPIEAQSYMEENNLDKLLIIGDISSIGHKVR